MIFESHPDLGWGLILIHVEMKDMNYCVSAQLIRSCPTLCDPMDCNPPGSSVFGIFPARMLEWVAISFSNNLLCQDIICIKNKKDRGLPWWSSG